MSSGQALSRPRSCIPRHRMGVDGVGICAEGACQAVQLLSSCGDTEEAVCMGLRPLGELCIPKRLSGFLIHDAGTLLSGAHCGRWPDRVGASKQAAQDMP